MLVACSGLSFRAVTPSIHSVEPDHLWLLGLPTVLSCYRTELLPACKKVSIFRCEESSMVVENRIVESRAIQPNESDVSETSENLKSRITGQLLAGVILLVFVTTNLPYQYVEVEPTWLGPLDLPESQQAGEIDLPIMAGWPLRYSVAYHEPNQLVYRDWKPLNLVLNTIFCVCSCWFTRWFMVFRHRSLSVASDTGRRRLIFDSFFAFCILVIPLLIVGSKTLGPYKQRQAVRPMLNTANFYASAWIPQAIEPHVPQTVKRWLQEVRHARLSGAKAAVAKRVANIPTLVSLHAYSGEHDLEVFENLKNRLHFNSLYVSNSKLNDSEAEAISKLQWLKHLKFPFTRLTAKQFHQFDSMPLLSVDLQGTTLPYAEIQKVQWRQTCELLWLSRPDDGVKDTLMLKDWAKLKTLSVKRTSYELNDAVLGLRLENLPELRRLCLDRVQKHDLALINVPRLAQLDEEIVDSRFAANQSLLVPGLTWVRNFEADGADSLTEIGCYAKDLEQLSLGKLPNLQKFKLGAFLLTLLGNVVPEDADIEKSRQWIRYLGKRQGPIELDLGYLPLQGVDLSPLSYNDKVKRLNLNGSNTDYTQLKQIGTNKKYDTLDARTTSLNGQQFVELLSQFPDLERLLVDGDDLGRLDLVERDRLKMLRVSTMRQVENVSLVDQPAIRTSLQMVTAPDSLRIENVPGLEGLSVEAPWPAVSKINGLRDLEWFAGGGSEVDDEIAEEVLRCANLHRLTFAYPSVSEETLLKIGELQELISLALPGTPLNDEIVRSWREVDDLWEVNFDDTHIAAETMVWLSRMPALRRVSLNRIQLNDEITEAMVELRQICELHLAGSQLPAETLSVLLSYGYLEVLNITHWDLNEEVFSVLETQGKRLTHLILGDSKVSLSEFRRLLDISESIFVEAEAYPSQLTDDEIATLHNRADSLRRQSNSGWRLMLKAPQDAPLQFSRGDFTADRERRIRQRERPWMPTHFSVDLSRDKFHSVANALP